MWFIDQYFIEFTGILGFFILGLALFSKQDSNAKILLCISCVISAFYFILLGMYISAAMMLFSSIRVLTSLLTYSKLVGVFFIILSIILPFIIPSVDWVSALTGVTGTIGLFWFSGIKLRFIMLLTTLIWIVNGFVYGAWIAFFGECFVFTVGSIRFYRMWVEYKLNNKESVFISDSF